MQSQQSGSAGLSREASVVRRAGVKKTALRGAVAFNEADLLLMLPRIREPVSILRDPKSGHVGIAPAGGEAGLEQRYERLATLPALYPEWLGDRQFCEIHNTRFPYVSGAMANGIATTTLVIEMAKAGMLGFYGAAGLGLDRVEEALALLERELDPAGLPWGSNLIHSPNENGVEAATVELYLKRGVRRVSASAYMALTPHVVRYAVTGLFLNDAGEVERKNHLFAKVSRAEVARHFMSPAPAGMLEELVREGKITALEATLAARVPVAEDYTLEGDSGGHTDNQILAALFSSILELRSELNKKYGYTRPIRLGAAGGIGTPTAVASAFSLGASFVVTGSINQGAVESGLSEPGRRLLAKAGIADVMMAPAADMFEQGVKVQVLKRGSMFAVRATKLYEVYTSCASIDEIPGEVRAHLEATLFKTSLDEIWNQTEVFWKARDPAEVKRATEDPRHKMALCFRWYLGQASRWAITGEKDRVLDYQIWCGPAMGAFNEWAKGTHLEAPENRTAVQIAKNLLEGAAIITRAQQLRTAGVPVPPAAFHYAPVPLS